MTYKVSKYNFIKTLTDGRVAIYNTKTGAISVSDANNKDSILEIFDNPNANYKHQDFHYLIEEGFIVEENKKEIEDIIKWYEDLYMKSNSIMLTLLPAEACNFACPYCFNYQDRQIIMEEWVYEALLNFIEKKLIQAETGRKPTVTIIWFGGEPLLAAEKIIEFMARVKELQNKYSFTLNGSIVTNGYYLTLDIFKRLIENGVMSYQVTLDGSKENHDKLRVLKNGQPTFDIIYKNLIDIRDNIVDKFQFQIRGNFLKTNLHYIHELLDLFIKDFNNDSRFQIYFRPVYNFETNESIKEVSSDLCTLEEGVDIQQSLAFDVIRGLNDEDRMNGYIRIFQPLPSPTFSWCNVEKYYMIGANGLVYLCDTFVGNPEKSSGQLNKDGDIIFKEGQEHFWKKSIFSLEQFQTQGCKDCKLLPICLGGCRRVYYFGGNKSCFWTEEQIYKTMEEYVLAQDKVESLIQI